jgi:xanthine/uracil permease
MAKKPAGLIYGVDDKPALLATVLLGIQHVFVMTGGWVIVVVIVTTIGGTQEEVANVLRMSMIASASRQFCNLYLTAQSVPDIFVPSAPARHTSPRRF